MKNVLLVLLVVSVTPQLCAQSKSSVFILLNKRTDQQELPKEQIDKLMEGHIAYTKKMAKEGKLLAAGRFEGGGGIFIFDTNSKERVSEWIQNDPAMQADQWSAEILLYTPRYGSICALQEPTQTTKYSFVRYIPNIAKFNVQDAPELFGKHDNYLKEIKKTGNVIAEGIFGDHEGGILVMKGEIQAEVIENDPAVREGLLDVDRKQLYIAKGTFCEK